VIGTKTDAAAYNYEVKMLQGLLILLSELPPELPTAPWDAAQRNALIEAHILHARNLIDFFLPGSSRRDDIRMSDFLDSEWLIIGAEKDRLAGLKPHMDKRLAHLTRQRHDEFRGWVSIVIAADLMKLNEDFVRRFAHEMPEQVDWFREAVVAQGHLGLLKV
jgi:hypothetical protein